MDYKNYTFLEELLKLFINVGDLSLARTCLVWEASTQASYDHSAANSCQSLPAPSPIILALGFSQTVTHAVFLQWGRG